MNQTLISIVVPIYNVEKYLQECIDSILKQTYQNIEIILVDDGSRDNCAQICDEYAQKDNRIKVIHKENGGLSDARNCGIDIAKGEYIAFIDSDDYVSEQYIEKLYIAIIENNTKLSQCNFSKVTDDKEEIEKRGYTENLKIKSGYEMIKDLYTSHWENIVAWNKLYSKELFENLRYPCGKINEDEFTTYKILYNVDKIAIVEESLYKYRQNENSIMGKPFKLQRLDVLQAFDERLEFFEQNNEKELYEITLRAYLGKIRECYVKTRKYIKHSEDVQKDLIKKYIMNLKNISNIKKIKHILKKYIAITKYKKYQRFCKKNMQPEFLIFNSPIHGNIGDHAIIYAEYKMLEKLNIKAFEIPTYEEKYYFDYIKQHISKDATISITGGGFIGSQWIEEENLVNKVIQNFKENKIIIFPATFYFKNDEQGKRELEKSIKTINQAKNIHIFARESKTYEFVKNTYTNVNVSLVPDIVLSLEKELPNDCERDGILLCLRKDVEGVLSKQDKEIIFNIISNYDKNIKQTDTVEDYTVKPQNREKEINKKLKEFASSKIVITDRLHGMIFAVITNTPCIVLGNYNYKVKGVYENWIKGYISNVVFIDNVQDINKYINKLTILNDQNVKFDFKELIKILGEDNG